MRSLIGFGIGDDDDDGEENRKRRERIETLFQFIKKYCPEGTEQKIKDMFRVDSLHKLDNGSLFDAFLACMKMRN